LDDDTWQYLRFSANPSRDGQKGTLSRLSKLQVHHDIWDYDAASPVVLFDTVINGQPRKGIAEAGRTGWVYILDRTNGKPLIGIEERSVPQDPRQKTAETQPYPIGDATVPQCAESLSGYGESGCIFTPFWETPTLIQPSGIGGTNWRRQCPTVPTPAISTYPGPCAPAPSRATATNTWSASAMLADRRLRPLAHR
jgi:hypothetical protein